MQTAQTFNGMDALQTQSYTQITNLKLKPFIKFPSETMTKKSAGRGIQVLYLQLVKVSTTQCKSILLQVQNLHSKFYLKVYKYY